jgi:biotin operon repressor
MDKTNNETLLKYLQEGNIVTTRNAPDELGIADVRANIRDLRNAGVPIEDRWVTGENRRGKKTRYKEYFIVEKAYVAL